MRPIVSLLMCVLLLAACSRADSPPAAKVAESPPPQAPAPAPTLPSDAAGVIDLLRQRGLPIGEVVAFTAETDPNKSLGRPNQYTSKATFLDTRLHRERPEQISADDGGTVETFANEGDAKARQAYVGSITSKVTPFAEYAYLDGKVLLRVSKRLTPDQAAQYEAVLRAPGTQIQPLPAIAQQGSPTPFVVPTIPAPPPPPSTAERVRVTGAGADGVNMRAEPSATAARVKLLRDGQQLEIAGENRDAGGRTWRNVRDPSDGATGWVAAEFVTAASAAPAPAAPAEKPAEPTAAPKPAAPAPTAAPKVIAPTSAPKPSGNRAPPQGGSCPASHPVKGNQGSRSNTDWIYHVPGSRSYAATQPEECFATAADAAAAGYRAPQR